MSDAEIGGLGSGPDYPIRDVVAEWLDDNYGEHTQQPFVAFQAMADELLKLIAEEAS